MNGRDAGPLSPVSMGGSEWSGISKYQTLDTDTQYSSNNRGQLASPPISSGSNGTMNGGSFSRGPGANSPSNGPSPPASIARSSNGASLYNGSAMNGGGENGRRAKDEQFEASLSEHYVALQRYLAASLRDEKGNPRPNKARDKLLRLSPVQFQELSTDVYDELQRRQSSSRKGSAGGPAEGAPPPFLLPKDLFHPKRNQARQKLSTLPPPRFRDLATDVFYELERRFPRFAGGDINRTDSPASMRGPPSRIGTPVDGGPAYRPGSRGGPGGPRIRRPSEVSVMSGVSAMSAYPRSDSRNGSRNGGPMNGMPSPGLPPEGYGRPQPKTFQSNTIVPNKSTMVEDDDDQDNDDEDAFNLENAARGQDLKNNNNMGSEADKKAIEDYKAQVAELREKLETMEDSLRHKGEELSNALDDERSRAGKFNMEKKELSDLRFKLENQLADARNLNESLQSELDRVRSEQSNMERDLRAQIDELRLSSSGIGGDSELERENQELKEELREQQDVTEEVRREAQEFLREMRMLSERSGSSFEKEEQLSNQVNKLEEEVKDWRNRYARTKTQLRSLRASSIGLTIQHDAAKYAKESGFTGDDGLVKDVHVTKFQISIDELLRTARTDEPEKVVDYMKAVVVNVRRITQDIDESSSNNGELAQQQTKLKSRVSATANNLITASRNFAAAKGLSPLSLLDAAASHLTAAVVELVRTAKIRPTPAGELEDDDDGILPPVDTTGFFPVRDDRQEKQAPPFLGLRNDRASAISSVYSSGGSPRESTVARPRSSSAKDSWASRRPLSRNGPTSNGINGLNGNKNYGPGPIGFGIRTQESDVEDLKIYLEDQTALLVQTIQSLVSSIRSESGITAITTELTSIAAVVLTVTTSTTTAMSSTANHALRTAADPIVKKLSNCRTRLLDAAAQGRRIADMGDSDQDQGRGEMEWRVWTQGLPPIAFEIARETKELVQRVDGIDAGGRAGAGAGATPTPTAGRGTARRADESDDEAF